MNQTVTKKFSQLVEIMHRLRKECPWDKKQTPQSLRQYILEESHEVIEAIDDEKWKELGEELGDLLLQIIFQSVIAEEDGRFSLENVLDNINKKMIERHPHVFGDKEVSSSRDVEKNWEHIKIKKENRDSLLGGVPKNAPALLRAQRLQEKASRVGFDWEEISGVFDKFQEEFEELKDAINKRNRDNIEEEIGDMFFSLVNISRFLNVVAEDSLRRSNEKFKNRFNYIENYYQKDYHKIKDAGIEELDKIWDKYKEENLEQE